MRSTKSYEFYLPNFNPPEHLQYLQEAFISSAPTQDLKNGDP